MPNTLRYGAGAGHGAQGEGKREFTAPARVNLLGEHTDYTGGLVLPMAIPFFTVASIAVDGGGSYRFVSEQFQETKTLPVEDRSAAQESWSDYPVGVLRQMQERGLTPPGFELSLRGNIPSGAGLSSSAAIEVATAFALLWAMGEQMEPAEIALLCQRAENDYVGSPCGIMDQFAVTAGRAGHALLLNTRSLEYEAIPMNGGQLAETCIVVCNSMVKHSIASGDYGLRRREVEAGQRVLVERYPRLRDLGDAMMTELQACEEAMPRESFLRCRHIITENQRVREVKDAMLAGDAVRVGSLMVEAHASQRDDFQCSCEEIDFLVDAAVSLTGCFGARMTGGGFGGCTVNLVTRERADGFASTLKERYRERFGIEAETYLCEAVDGAVVANGGAVKESAVRS